MTSLFEKIAKREIPASIIREDEEFMAFLDIFPNCKGQTLVIPKTRYDSRISLMPEDVYIRYMLAVRQVIVLLKKGLGCNRIGIIVEGLGVNHVHVKLYPMYGLDDKWQPTVVDEKARFDVCPGYLTSVMGEMKGKEELDAIAQEITKQI